MRVFVAALRTETNSFVSRLTSLADFRAGAVTAADVIGDATGDLTLAETGEIDAAVHPGYATFVRLARQCGLETVCGSAAYAVPGGPVESAAYARLKGNILSELAQLGPFDVVLLDLHGAMMAEDVDDCEGDLLNAVRRIVGPKPVVAGLLDPHATLSPAMVQAASLLHAYKEYPHIDVVERAEELFRLSVAAGEGLTHPTACVVECRALGGFATRQDPMAQFVASLRADEADPGVLSVSLIHGFPWSDSPHNGAKALVYTDGAPVLAHTVARAVAERFRSIVPVAAQVCLSLDEGVAQARRRSGERLVLADVSDNPGGGGDGDAMHLLHALRSGGLSGIGAALIHDRSALQACLDAGVGAQLTLSVGGKLSRHSGTPLRITGVVAGIAQSVGPGSGARTQSSPVGPVARFSTDFADLVLCGDRREALWPTLFTQTGADVSDYRLIVLKSSNHFRAAFEDLVDDVISIGTPTAMNPDIAALPFKYLPRPIWPLDALPELRPSLSPSRVADEGE